MKLKHKNMSRQKMWLLVLAMIATMSACKKTDNFYATEKATPEIDLSQKFAYRLSYNIGDTMTVTGRLNPNDGLQIKVGGVNANILSAKTITYGTGTQAGQQTMDQVKFLITTQMGIGTGRPVAVSTGGYSINGPSIEIATSGTAAGVKDTLKITEYYTLPDNAIMLYCKNGKGSVYYYDQISHNIQLVKKGAQVNTVLNTVGLKDQTGNFSVVRFYSGGIDPQENFLYFSVKVTDGQTDNATNLIYKLCRYNIKTSELITLNRTAIPTNPKLVAVANFQPFEGNLSQIKMIAAGGIYPDSKGAFYMTLRVDHVTPDFGHVPPYAIVSVDAAGNLKYILKEGDQLTNFTPYVFYAAYGVSAGIDALNQVLPGTGVLGVFFDASAKGNTISFSPDEKTAYFTQYGFNKWGLFLYDLEAKAVVSQTTKILQTVGPVLNPVFTGSFVSASFYVPLLQTNSGTLTYNYYLLPLDKQRVLLLGDEGVSTNNYHFMTEDLINNRADNYSPGTVTGIKQTVNGSFLMFGIPPVTTETTPENQEDKALNFDEDGMVYATMGKYSSTLLDANGKAKRLGTVIVKTEIK